MSPLALAVLYWACLIAYAIMTFPEGGAVRSVVVWLLVPAMFAILGVTVLMKVF